MANAQNFRLKCRNPKCGHEFLRRWSIEEFDKLQYGGATKGIPCFDCGFSKMLVMRSKRQIHDGFQPGFQRNIRKYCSTYAEYKQHLKDMGLVELGYEDLPEQKEERINYWDDAMLKKINDMGIYISGREAKALAEGKIDQM